MSQGSSSNICFWPPKCPPGLMVQNFPKTQKSLPNRRYKGWTNNIWKPMNKQWDPTQVNLSEDKQVNIFCTIEQGTSEFTNVRNLTIVLSSPCIPCFIAEPSVASTSCQVLVLLFRSLYTFRMKTGSRMYTLLLTLNYVSSLCCHIWRENVFALLENFAVFAFFVIRQFKTEKNLKKTTYI